MDACEIPKGAETVEVLGRKIMVPVDARWLAVSGSRVGFYDSAGDIMLWTEIK